HDGPLADPAEGEMRGPAPTMPDVTVGTPRPPLRKGLIAAVGVPAFLLGVLLAASRPLLGMVVRSRAEALGFDLQLDKMETGWSALRLRNARVSLKGVRGANVTAGAVRLTRSGLSFATVAAEDVALALEGAAGDRVLEVASWSIDHGEAFHLRGSASNVRLSW